jgi:cell division septation protein DedD
LIAPSDTTLYIAIHAYTSYSGLTVLGRHWPGVVSLAPGVTASGISSNVAGSLQDYKLPSVQPGEKVECKLAGSNGDADLFVRFGDLPETSPTSALNACRSVTVGGSTEACTTEAAAAAVDAYATVYTTAPYSGLYVVCRRFTSMPTRRPTEAPTRRPTKKPTKAPTKKPTNSPTKAPTKKPTRRPTRSPTRAPVVKSPTKAPATCSKVTQGCKWTKCCSGLTCKSNVCKAG